MAGRVNEETGILTIVAQPNTKTFALFTEEGIFVKGSGNPAWIDDFVGVCFDAGYKVSNYELEDAAISIGEKLPYWDTCVEV